MKIWLLATALLCGGMVEHALGQVQYSGPATPGHVPSNVTNSVIQDSGAATAPKATEFGVHKNGGLPLCVVGSNNPPPQTDAHTNLCLSVTGAQATINVIGPGTPTLGFNVNGVNTPFLLASNVPTLGGLLSTVGASSFSGSATVLFNGYNTTTDSGGGVFANLTNLSLTCNPDGGTCVKDSAGTFFARTDLADLTPVDFGCKVNTAECAPFFATAFNTFATIDPSGSTSGLTIHLPPVGAVKTSTGIVLGNGDAVTGQCGGITLSQSSPVFGPSQITGAPNAGNTTHYIIDSATPPSGPYLYGVGVRCLSMNSFPHTNVAGIRLNGRLGKLTDLDISLVGEDAVTIQGSESWFEDSYIQGLGDYSPASPPASRIGVLQTPKSNIYTYAVEINGSQSALTSSNAFATGVIDTGGANFQIGTVAEFVDTGFYLNGVSGQIIGAGVSPANGSGFVLGSQALGYNLIDAAVGQSCSGGAFAAFEVAGGNANRFISIEDFGTGPGVVDTTCTFGYEDTATSIGKLRNYVDASSVVGLIATHKFHVAAAGGTLIQTPHGDPSETQACNPGPIALDDPNHLNGVGDAQVTDTATLNTCTFTGGWPGMDLRFTITTGNDCVVNVCGPGTWDLLRRGANWITMQAGPPGALPFASAPNCAAINRGQQFIFTDANNNSWGLPPGSGGTFVVLAWCNGSQWTVIGK